MQAMGFAEADDFTTGRESVELHLGLAMLEHQQDVNLIIVVRGQAF